VEVSTAVRTATLIRDRQLNRDSRRAAGSCPSIDGGALTVRFLCGNYIRPRPIRAKFRKQKWIYWIVHIAARGSSVQ
jgi:hypothetical protein